MQDLNDIYYFVQIVAHGGIAQAARSIGVQKSTLSRRLALLEDRLGVTLIYRSTRCFTVTETGHEYYRQCLVVLEDMEAAQTVIDKVRVEPQGTIRIVCPPGLLNYQFSDLVARFMRRYQKVEIQLKTMNRSVDVIGEGYDLAIRENSVPPEQSALVLRKLGINPQCLVASPELLAGGRSPSRIADLASLPSVAYGMPQIETAIGAPARSYEWSLRDEADETVIVRHTPRLVTDSFSALHMVVLQGLGVGQLPSLMVGADIEAGRLVRLLPSMCPDAGTVYAVFPSRRGLSPSVRAFVDFVVEAFTPKETPAAKYSVDGVA